MPEDPVVELRELVEGLSEWLRYQRRLGWRGLADVKWVVL